MDNGAFITSADQTNKQTKFVQSTSNQPANDNELVEADGMNWNQRKRFKEFEI